MKIVQDSSSEKSTNKIVKRTKFQGPRILSLILSFSTSIRYFASAPGWFFCLWCKEEPCRWAASVASASSGKPKTMATCVQDRTGRREESQFCKKRDFHNKVTWTDPDQTGNSLDLFQPGQLIRESIFTCTSCSLEFTCTEIQLQNPLVVLSKNELASLEAFLKLWPIRFYTALV